MASEQIPEDDCPECGDELRRVIRSSASLRPIPIVSCLSCSFEKAFAPIPVGLEAEFDLELEVAIPEKLSIQQLKTLRACDEELRDRPVSEVSRQLKQRKSHRFGQFFDAPECYSVKKTLEAVGLQVINIAARW